MGFFGHKAECHSLELSISAWASCFLRASDAVKQLGVKTDDVLNPKSPLSARLADLRALQKG